MRHALSFDVEEYFQVSNFERIVDRREWDGIPSRVADSTRRILDQLERAGVRATFFLLGWVAERHPGLVREIRAAGHELGSHGYDHRLVFDLGEDGFREDVTRTRAILEDLAGPGSVHGYRAPSFSITPRSAWALRVLVETRHAYDSSIFPVRHPRYGWIGSDPYVHARETEAGVLWELPPTTAPAWGGGRLPAAGGAYLRLFPLALVRRGLRASERAGHPGVVYLHPWEFDPDQPRLRVPWHVRIRHYANLERTASRLARLLDEFEFGTVGEAWRRSASGTAAGPPDGSIGSNAAP